MSIVGAVRIRICASQGRVTAAQASAGKTVDMTALLAHRTPAQASAFLSVLFAVCPAAQGAACALALAAAAGREMPSSLRQALLRANALETLRENVMLFGLRLCPGQDAARATAAAGFVREIRALQKAGSALPADLAGRMRDFLTEGFAPGWNAEVDLACCFPGKTPLAAAMQRLADSPREGLTQASAELPSRSAILADSAVLAEKPFFCGALSRRRGDPVVAAQLRAFGNTSWTRYYARLAEFIGLLADPEAISRTAASLRRPDGTGAGYIETARGLLVHEASLAPDGTIARYSVLSPTEINMGDFSALSALLAQLPGGSDEDIQQQARSLLESFDPCLPATIEVTHA